MMGIEIQNVEFAYNGKQPLFTDLSLNINSGDIVSIVGNSGCGKTTLLNLIAGVLTPSKGDIRKSDSNIAYLMQDVTLLPYRTAWENTFLACELRRIAINEKKEAATKLLAIQYRNGCFREIPQGTFWRNEATNRFNTNFAHRCLFIST
mgnify:CR=1 FL=1